MGKITKKATAKHDASLSPAFTELIASLGKLSLAEIPRALSKLSTRWPYPRGDLYNWIVPLNRFDEILHDFIGRYGLNTGAQSKPFGITQLLEGSPGLDEKGLQRLGYGPEGDRELVESILNATILLLEKCGNRAIYSGGDRLNDLLNTTSLSLLKCALKLSLCLAKRYHDRLRNYGQPFIAPETIHQLDLDKLQKLSNPMGQEMPSTSKVGSTSPTKTTKSRDKASHPDRLRRSSVVVNPNEFRSFCHDVQSKAGSGKGAQSTEADWQQWANVKLTFSPTQNPPKSENAPELANGSAPPDSPTPNRRQSNTPSSRLSRLSTTEESAAKIIPGAQPEVSRTTELEISSTELTKNPIDVVLNKSIVHVPQAAQYELLHKLRVAYGLITSNATRRQLLTIRLLAYTCIAYVHPESTLPSKLFGQDKDSMKPQQLIQELVNLLHDGDKSRFQVPLEIQTLSLEVLSALTKQKVASSEIISALGVNSNHGLLMVLSERAVQDIRQDEDSTDNQEGDEWRDMVFSMLKTCLEVTSHFSRSSDTFATANIISCYANALLEKTPKALRIHGRVIELFKAFGHLVKDGLGVLNNNRAFEALCDLFAFLTDDALRLEKDGQGIQATYKTSTTDYDIPYVHQQVIRAVVDLLNDVSGHQGTHADRVVRALIDSPILLRGLHRVIDNVKSFGPHTWSEVVKCVGGFLHYEPTSYAIIADAGLIRSILRTVTMDENLPQLLPALNHEAGPSIPNSGEVQAEATEAMSLNNPQASATSKTISTVPEHAPQGIPPTKDTIATIASSFSAICLTAGGSDTFMASGALQKFFEIFESPAHIKALKAGNLLNLLGSTFDELARHHYHLKPAIVSATIVMIARVRYICQSKAWSHGAGPKLWVDNGHGLAVSGGNQSLLIDISPPTRINPSGQTATMVPLRLPDGNLLEPPPDDDHSASVANITPSEVDADGLTTLDYTTAALGFLAALFENQSICTSFMEGGGTDLILDLATLPSMPDEQIFGPDGYSTELANITHMMTETKPHLVLPSLLQRALFACEEAQHFSQNQPRDTSCYFELLVRQNSSTPDQMDIDSGQDEYVVQNGTRIVKSLVAVYHLVQLVSEVFETPIYNSRSHGQPFGQVNLGDVYSELCETLGGLSAACIRESIALQQNIPDRWLVETRPKWFFGADEEINSILGLRDTQETRDATPVAASPANGHTELNAADESKSLSHKSIEISEAEKTASFKNIHFLRHLLVKLPSTITAFFKSLGRGVVGKRRIDTYHKQNATKVAASIAAALKTQLCPTFFNETAKALSSPGQMDARFGYLAVVLNELNSSLFDPGNSPDQGQQCNIAVLSAFKAIGGMSILNSTGTEFFNELKRCELAHETIKRMAAANSGLKSCLQIFDSLVSPRCLIESPQSNTLKNIDATRPFYFVPSQLLLELRLDALPLTRLIWESEYADQASIAVVGKLISILKHVLSGDHEHEAYRHSSSKPVIYVQPAKKLPIDSQKVTALAAQGIDEELAREALFRCHGNSGWAEEYCKALDGFPKRQRCPVPQTELETSRSRTGEGSAASNVTPAMDASDNLPQRDRQDATVAELLSAIASGESEELIEDTSWAPPVAAMEPTEGSGEDPSVDRPSANAMSINNILNAGDAPEAGSQAKDPVESTSDSAPQELPSVDVMNAKRESIREDLAERCNNLLDNHHGIIFELADLILSGAKRLSDDTAKTFRSDATDLLINALSSLQDDGEITESKGKKIAASAHLTALLLQDKAMFESAESLLREAFDSLLLFVRIPQSDGPTKEDSFPWIGPVLLILEKMLSRDAEPEKIEWRSPTDLEATGPAHFTPANVFRSEQKPQLFNAVIELLPRIGKDKPLALSVARVLVILTRDRELASLLAQKRSIQRLFVMVKQLVTGTNERLQSALMLILRHVIEDEETLRQIMKSEIIASFGNRSSSRQIDTTAFVRELHHLALRSPKIFVEVANNIVKLQRYERRESAQILVLKPLEANGTGTAGLQVDNSAPSSGDAQTETRPEESVEVEGGGSELPSKRKAESRPPVVEHPDGIIHFLLSELLSYKDVEDKAVNGTTTIPEETGTQPFEHGSREASASPAPAEQPPTILSRPKQDKVVPKAEDHPIYVYRCFLLQCLTELLLSYNRTKIEFINFSRKADPLVSTPSKPRSGVLNYLLTSLVPGSIETEDSIASKKKATTSSLAMKVIVALCSKTFEVPPSTNPVGQEDQDDEPDLTFVRRFVLEHAIKAFKDASVSSDSWEARYSRMLGLADLFNRLLTKASSPDGAINQPSGQHSSFRILSRMMFEKNLISVLTSSLADIDLTLSGAKRVIKYILKPLNELTITASRLSMTSPTPISSALGSAEEDISSASSVSDMQDEREETPDLYRHSALGIMEPHHQDESSSDSNDDEDEDMYEEEYVDEMDYDDGGVDEGPDDGEVVSDEEIDGHIEGLPGDAPMGIELVMNGGHDMDVDTEDDDEDGDEDEDEEETDDDGDGEDGEDFDIEGDEDIDMGGELNADDENDSLGAGPEDGEEDWEDEGEEDEEIEFHNGTGALPDFSGADHHDDIETANVGPQEALNNLLQAYNENPDDTEANMESHLDALIGPRADEDGPDDEEDDDEEGDEMDEEMGFDAFDDMLEGHEDILDQHDPWAWGEPSLPRRHRHLRPPGNVPHFLSRHVRQDAAMVQLLTSSHRRHAAPARPGGDDGTNPLLQRPATSNEPNRVTSIPHLPLPTGLQAHLGHHPPFGAAFSRLIESDVNAAVSVHGEMLDAVMQALHRGGEVDLLRPGRFQISFDAQGTEIPRILRAGMPTVRSLRDDTFRIMSREEQLRGLSFEARATAIRWQEEVRILFGNGYLEISLRAQKALLSVLVPPAQAAEKIRRKEAEEAAEAERQRKAKQEEVDRLKREEEREAAAKAEREAAAAVAAEAEARAAALARDQEAHAQQDSQQTETEPMEGVEATNIADQRQSTDGAVGVPAAAGTTNETPRVFTTIRGRQLDITNMSIDAEYLEALPEDIREEVIMQQYAEQREQAQEAGGDANAIDPDFLDALPEDIREEIRQQEAHIRRRREREAARRQATTSNGPAQPEEMDNDNFLATLDPALRRAVLADQPPEILQQLDPRYAAEGRAHARHMFGFRGMSAGRDARDELEAHEHVQRDSKRQVVQMIDKYGVATLLRLMFVPHQGSLRQNLFTVLQNVCGHRQTRFEVVSLLLIILKEGSADVTAVEKSLANLSLRAKVTSSQKTPQPLKRTLSMQANAGISEEMTPVMVMQQCLAALSSLSRRDAHVKSIFLREVDVSSSVKSRSKKGKGKENKTTKCPLNDLISLLDRKLIMENSTCLQSFAELLNIVTAPLPALMRKEKADESKSDHSKEGHKTDQTAIEGTSTAMAQDESMTEAPPEAPENSQVPRGVSVDHAADRTTSAAIQTGGETQESSALAENPDQSKAKKIFDPPAISDHNLQLVVSILVAQESGRETFNVALEAIAALSHIPGTSAIFSTELTKQAKALAQSILGDLDDLLPLIRESQSGTDLQGIALTKFTPTTSDQSKLLRILMALDYISAPKRPESQDKDSVESISNSSLTASYESLSLGPLWSKLSECLTTIREKDNIFSFATILLPLIESLMVVCKNTSLKDAPLTRSAREQSVTSPGHESLSDLEELFFTFTTEHRKILNEIVRQNPKLMSGSGNFALLVKNPKVLEFDNKRNYFTKQIHSRQRELHRPQPPLQLSVRRDNVFLDSFKSLYFKSPEEMKYGKLNIRFHGEEGVDAGGVTREWFQVLARGMFNANYALWEPVASDKTTFHPSKLSGVNSEHLMFFKFIGRIIGKALHEGRVLDCHFSRAVYKKMLGKEPSLKDLESNDQDYYKSLVWILENDITDQFDAEFSVISEGFGAEEVIDLIEDGRNVAVTEANKHEYVQKLVEYRLTGSVKEQLENFLRGFYDIIPAELIAIFNEHELELLISGLPEIDVDDWKANTEYHNYTASSQQIQWFWRAVRGMSQEERAKLLQFITGTSKVPLNGFKELEGIHGTTKTSIHRSPQKEQLPTSHTCFNQLDLPDYPTYEELRSKLMTSVYHGHIGFGFA